MKKIIIFGTTAFSRLMKWYIENDSDDKIISFTLNEQYINEKYFCDLPVIPYENLKEIYPEKDFQILITVGYSQMNKIREKIYNQCIKDGYEIASFIHSTVTRYSEDIGKGNIFLEGVKLQPFCKVGNGNIVQHFTIISHEAEVGNFNYFAGNSHIAGLSKVDNNCFVGINGIVQNDVHLASYNLVGAGTCVSKDTEEFTVTAPNKTRSFKTNIRAMSMFLK